MHLRKHKLRNKVCEVYLTLYAYIQPSFNVVFSTSETLCCFGCDSLFFYVIFLWSRVCIRYCMQPPLYELPCWLIVQNQKNTSSTYGHFFAFLFNFHIFLILFFYNFFFYFSFFTISLFDFSFFFFQFLTSCYSFAPYITPF